MIASEHAVLLWVASGFLAVPLYIFWWTRESDFTSSELLVVLFFCILGPFFLVSSIFMIAGVWVSKVWRIVFPKERVLWERRK